VKFPTNMKAYQLQSRLAYLKLVPNGWKGTLRDWQMVNERNEFYEEIEKFKKSFNQIWP